jgi:putative membrane protein
MNDIKTVSWKDAFWASPGPRTLKSAALLVFKGLCMGSADIIPGVSGGTIALITGIYADLLEAIRSAKIATLKKLVQFDLKGALSDIHIRFLISLFLGIGTAILSLARVMNYLIHHQPVFTWSLFFGLIAASILTVGKKVPDQNAQAALSFLVGAALAWVFVGLIPISTPEDLWFIFLAGFVAICAMILPGLSGAFLLLILGKYEYITGTLKNPFLLDNIVVIAVFCCGCLGGILGFSRVLNYLLSRWYGITLAFLTGLMAGALRKIWPWKEVLEEKLIRGKLHVLRDQNILPEGFSKELLISLALMATGFLLVIALERYSTNKEDPSIPAS